MSTVALRCTLSDGNVKVTQHHFVARHSIDIVVQRVANFTITPFYFCYVLIGRIAADTIALQIDKYLKIGGLINVL